MFRSVSSKRERVARLIASSSTLSSAAGDDVVGGAMVSFTRQDEWTMLSWCWTESHKLARGGQPRYDCAVFATVMHCTGPTDPCEDKAVTI